ncbi:MAG TPA: bifunctional glutamate N-acetyltransferase/amino-acid acetyltransferase ArgJ [Planctomycetota bacterium]|nr:bifunctional glutamate N-acetyltransferase/amino-acid acetyltransferase ArgJ [Planctomycetota bacterium]HUV39043.1 bifunctional glutamate N-acetyltransferase/amino-acid acetyltransferase ArgJ [Planctomycetota bacterium]
MKRPTGVITHPAGFSASGVSCGIKTGRDLPDLGLLVAEEPVPAAAVFTTNKVCAAPVLVSREHLRTSRGYIRAVVANSGNANACTGKQGLADARRMTQLTAELIGAQPHEVLVASTGVIGRPMPMKAAEAGIRKASEKLSSDYRGGAAFLRGILTTDRFPKEAERSVHVAGRTFLVSGVVKGAAMIAPGMATMLSFVTTDAGLERRRMQGLLSAAVGRTFNRITVDGHMSTNDTCVLLASGRSGVKVTAEGRMERKFARALEEVLLELALAIVRDGEGAVRTAEIRVRGARSDADAERAARAVAGSPLVKTALFGADPNWGRIVSMAGASGCAFTEDKTSLRINSLVIYRNGKPLPVTKDIENAMRSDHVVFDLSLGLGRGASGVYTCDLGHNYVRLNAEYTT